MLLWKHRSVYLYIRVPQGGFGLGRLGGAGAGGYVVPMRRILPVFLVVVAGLAAARVRGATLTVCPSGCDYPSIKAAIDAAAPGDVIEIAAGVYPLSEPVRALGKAVTLRGAVDSSGAPTTVLDAQGQRRVIEAIWGEGPGTVFENLVVRNGAIYGPAAYGGGIYVSKSSPQFVNCTVTGNFGQGWDYQTRGGGVHLSRSNSTFTRCRIVGNAAYGPLSQGGGVHIEGSNPTFTDCAIEGNWAPTAGYGGGVFMWRGLAPSHSVFSGCTIRGNSAGSSGGGICIFQFASMSLDGVTISGNAVTAQSGLGGGVYMYDGVSSVSGSIICGNTVTYGSQVDAQGSSSWVDLGGNCGGASCVGCYPDFDGDGLLNEVDNCPAIANPGQEDCDADGLGDACELAAGAQDVNRDAVPDECQCIADANLDGTVDGGDLAAVLDGWGLADAGKLAGDIDDDSDVDATDLALLLARWGRCR